MFTVEGSRAKLRVLCVLAIEVLLFIEPLCGAPNVDTLIAPYIIRTFGLS